MKKIFPVLFILNEQKYIILKGGRIGKRKEIKNRIFSKLIRNPKITGVK